MAHRWTPLQQRSTSQEEVVIKEHTSFEPLDTIRTEDIKLALRAENESAKEMAQDKSTEEVENVKTQKTTDKLAQEVLFQLPPTEVSFSDKLPYNVKIRFGVSKAALYVTSWVFATSAGPSLMIEAYLKLHLKRWNKRLMRQNRVLPASEI